MASTQEYRDYILDQLTGLEGISCQAMMGEYLLYCQGKLVGGIYDNRLLVKPTASAVRLLPDARSREPGTADRTDTGIVRGTSSSQAQEGKESLTILKRREKHENRPEHAP